MGQGSSTATPEQKMAAKTFVDEQIKNNKVVVFSKTYCPYCTKAKRALSAVIDLNSVVIIELDKRSDGDAIQDYLLEITGGRSVPRVFIAGKFIGGGDDTARLQQSGELLKLLQDAGAV